MIWKVVLPSGRDVNGTWVGETRPNVYRLPISGNSGGIQEYSLEKVQIFLTPEAGQLRRLSASAALLWDGHPSFGLETFCANAVRHSKASSSRTIPRCYHSRFAVTASDFGFRFSRQLPTAIFHESPKRERKLRTCPITRPCRLNFLRQW